MWNLEYHIKCWEICEKWTWNICQTSHVSGLHVFFPMWPFSHDLFKCETSHVTKKWKFHVIFFTCFFVKVYHPLSKFTKNDYSVSTGARTKGLAVRIIIFDNKTNKKPLWFQPNLLRNKVSQWPFYLDSFHTMVWPFSIRRTDSV